MTIDSEIPPKPQLSVFLYILYVYYDFGMDEMRNNQCCGFRMESMDWVVKRSVVNGHGILKISQPLSGRMFEFMGIQKEDVHGERPVNQSMTELDLRRTCRHSRIK